MGFTKAAPFSENSEAKIVNKDENGNRIDLKQVLASVRAINQRLETGKAGPKIKEDEIRYLEQVMKEIKELYFEVDFDELRTGTQLQLTDLKKTPEKRDIDEVPFELSKRLSHHSLVSHNIKYEKDLFDVVWEGLKYLRKVTKCEGTDCIY